MVSAQGLIMSRFGGLFKRSLPSGFYDYLQEQGVSGLVKKCTAYLNSYISDVMGPLLLQGKCFANGEGEPLDTLTTAKIIF